MNCHEILKRDSRHPWTSTIRRGVTVALLGLATSGNFVRAEDDAPASSPPAVAATPLPFESMYVPEKSTCAVVVHPAALARQGGTIAPLTESIEQFNGFCAEILATVARNRRDMGKPIADLRLDFGTIETVVVGFETRITKVPGKAPDHTDDQMKLGAIADGFTVRTVAPFDWLTLLRSLPLSLREVHDGDSSYYSIIIPQSLLSWMGGDMPFAVLIPDDRTLVVNSTSWIKKLAHHEPPAAMAYFQGEKWARMSQATVALSLDNSGDALLKAYDPTWPDMQEVMLVVERLRGVERMTLGLSADAAGSLSLQAEGIARDDALARSIAASVGLYSLVGRGAIALDRPKSPADRFEYRLFGQFNQRIQIAATGRAINLAVRDFMTGADLTTLLADTDKTIDPAVQPAQLDFVPPAPPLMEPRKIQAFPEVPQLPQPPPPPARLAIPSQP